MQENQPIILSRDVEAIAIPSGVKFTLEKGTEVMISQSLGGTHTLTSHYGLSRIDAKDQDAIGMDAAQEEALNHPADGKIEESHVWDKLKTVYDPEIPVNIVDLGLVYHLTISPVETGGNRVDVKMTLTAPGCGMGPAIAADAKQKIMTIPGIVDAEVNLVWEPPWNQEMISEQGRMKLGMI